MHHNLFFFGHSHGCVSENDERNIGENSGKLKTTVLLMVWKYDFNISPINVGLREAGVQAIDKD